MTKVRFFKASVPGSGDVKVRIYKLAAPGSAPASTKVRIYKIGTPGVAALILAPFTDRSVEPMTVQTLTATLAPGSDTPTSYTWRIVPTTGSTPVTLMGTGATVTCRAPATRSISGGFVVIGVRGVKGSLISPEQTIRITTPPHLYWHATSTGLVPCTAPVAV